MQADASVDVLAALLDHYQELRGRLDATEALKQQLNGRLNEVQRLAGDLSLQNTELRQSSGQVRGGAGLPVCTLDHRAGRQPQQTVSLYRSKKGFLYFNFAGFLVARGSEERPTKVSKAHLLKFVCILSHAAGCVRMSCTARTLEVSPIPFIDCCVHRL